VSVATNTVKNDARVNRRQCTPAGNKSSWMFFYALRVSGKRDVVAQFATCVRVK
jgi:hypothetical protein